MNPRPPPALRRWVCWVQGAFWFVTGMWPWLHRGSFEAVTGPKVDWWLVETVGGLLAVTGVVLWCAARAGRITVEIAVLATGQAAVLCAIDVVYVTRERIAPVYLLDAVAEAVLVGLWLASYFPWPVKPLRKAARR